MGKPVDKPREAPIGSLARREHDAFMAGDPGWGYTEPAPKAKPKKKEK